MSKKKIILLMMIGALVAMPARAEIIPGFGGNHGTPITINAEELAIDRKAGQAVFSGQVEAMQSGQRLKARHMNVIYDPDPVQIRFLYASGDVQFIGRPHRGETAPRASGDLAEYNMATGKLILSGKVVLRRGAHIVRGQSLIVDLTTGQSLMDSTKKGRSGRVRGVLKRKKKPKNK